MVTSIIHPEKLLKFIERLLREKFYGVIEIHFENGRIFRLRKLHSIQGEELDRLVNA